MNAEFEAWYPVAWPRLLRQLVLIADTPEDAEEALAEAFARALSRWSRVRGLDNRDAWVRRVALNKLTDGYRARLRLLRHAPDLATHEDRPGPTVTTVDVTRALGALSPSQRQVLVLHHLGDQPLAQIAADLDLPLSTVKSHLQRGRSRMRALLPEYTEARP